MKYEARIREIKPADPGYFYVTYEYTDEHGSLQHVRADNARPITPFDIKQPHTINVVNGQLKEDISKGIKTIIACFTFMLLLIAAVSILQEFAIVLILLLFTCIPIFGCIKEYQHERKCRRIGVVASPIDGVIVSYKEVVKRSKNHTNKYYYPVIEYSCGGYTFQHVSSQDEEPLHKGERCLMYLDTQEEFLACETEVKAKSHVWANLIPCLFFLIPAVVITIAILLPDTTKAEIIETFLAQDMPQLIMNLALIPFGFVVCALLFLLGKQILRLLVLNKVIGSSPAIPVRLISEETYGTATVYKYEYIYQGTTKTHAVKYRITPEEVHINPHTLDCYTAGDKAQTILLIVILSIFTVLFSGALLLFV